MTRLFSRLVVPAMVLVAVAMGSVPVAAAGIENAGTVAVAGTASYTASAIPLASPCQGNSFTLSMTGAAADVELLASEYAGPVSLSGSGTTGCQTFTLGGAGSFSATLSGTAPVGELQCSIAVNFGAFGPTWSLDGGGSCTVAGQPVTVWVGGALQSAPTGVTAGGEVSSLALSGTLALCEASIEICPIPEIA